MQRGLRQKVNPGVLLLIWPFAVVCCPWCTGSQSRIKSYQHCTMGLQVESEVIKARTSYMHRRKRFYKMAECVCDGATSGNGSESVTRPLADVSGFISVRRSVRRLVAQTDKWVTAPLKKRLLQKQPTKVSGSRLVRVSQKKHKWWLYRYCTLGSTGCKHSSRLGG